MSAMSAMSTLSATGDSFVDAQGVRLRVRVAAGDRPGTPALVLHGFTGSVESMASVIEGLDIDEVIYGT